MSERQQHRVRKDLKHLRYLSEFASSVYPPGTVKRYLAALAPSQKVLGALNDATLARAEALNHPKTDKGARFAARWLKRSQRALQGVAADRLRTAANAPPFWAASTED